MGQKPFQMHVFLRGEMSEDLLANRKHLNEISEIFVYAKKSDKRNMKADVTSYINAVACIKFVVQKRCICPI